jgi:hypothetical protein
MPSFIDIDEPHVFALNDRIAPASMWMRNELGASSAIVISTRKSKYFRRERYMPQVMVADLPGRWFAASHFERT